MSAVFDRSERAKGLLMGVCIGNSLGAFLALLWAPMSGKELRHNVREKANKLLDATGETIEKAKRQTLHAVHNAKDRLFEEETSLRAAVKAGVDVYRHERHRA